MYLLTKSETLNANTAATLTGAADAVYRYWRLAFSQRGASGPNYRVAEVFLMQLLLDLNTDGKRPLHYRPSIPRDGIVAYRNQNRKLNAPRYQQTNISVGLFLC